MVAHRPRLRPLDVFPSELEGERVICLRDPTGLSDRVAFLPPPAIALVALFDGSLTVEELAGEFSKKAGAKVPPAVIQNLVDQLDEALFLDSPRLAEHRRALLDEFRAAPVRPASHAGASYPAEADELRAWLDRLVAAAPTSRANGHANGHAIRGLITPHIDFPRGGHVYAPAYAMLAQSAPPDLVVVFGTDHNGAHNPFTLTRKSYDTPLGPLATDVELVDALARELAGDDLFADEFHHRGEHSIEFQAVWLRHAFGERTPPALPVLCGSLHAHVEAGTDPHGDPAPRRFLDALRRLTSGRRVLVVAGADLAHVGPRFGDPPINDDGRKHVERADRASLDAAVRGDAAGFFQGIAAMRDRHRVCGLSPIWATLALTAGECGPGELVGYDQCDADERGESFVSVASVVLPAR